MNLGDMVWVSAGPVAPHAIPIHPEDITERCGTIIGIGDAGTVLVEFGLGWVGPMGDTHHLGWVAATRLTPLDGPAASIPE